MKEEKRSYIIEGFYKIAVDGGSLVTCKLYNPKTKELLDVIVDDYEYPYGEGPFIYGMYKEGFTPTMLEEIRRMPLTKRHCCNEY